MKFTPQGDGEQQAGMLVHQCEILVPRPGRTAANASEAGTQIKQQLFGASSAPSMAAGYPVALAHASIARAFRLHPI